MVCGYYNSNIFISENMWMLWISDNKLIWFVWVYVDKKCECVLLVVTSSISVTFFAFIVDRRIVTILVASCFTFFFVLFFIYCIIHNTKLFYSSFSHPKCHVTKIHYIRLITLNLNNKFHKSINIQINLIKTKNNKQKDTSQILLYWKFHQKNLN